MYHSRILLLVLGFLLLSFSVKAQNYKQLVQKAMVELSSSKLPDAKTTCHFKYKIRTQYWNPKQNPVSANVELLFNKEKAFARSDKADYYHDGKNAVSILKKERKIIWMESLRDAWQERDFSGVLDLHEQFYDKASYSRVQRKDEGQDLILIRITPSQEWRDKKNIDYILSEINTKTTKVERMLIQFSKKHTTKSIEFIYEIMDFNSNKKLNKSTQAIVFNSSGQLHKIYKGYQLIDLHKKN